MREGLVAFAGGIASGKTTLAISTARRLACPRITFSALLVELAEKRGARPSRDVLQALGAEWVLSNPRGFCEQLLAKARWYAGRTVVVDGIRHLIILEHLRKLIQPQRLWLVYVVASLEHRRARVLKEVGEDVLPLWEEHSTEAEVENLRLASDIVVVNESELQQATQEIERWLGEPCTRRRSD